MLYGRMSKELEISYINCKTEIMVLFVLGQYKTYGFFFFSRIENKAKDKFEHLHLHLACSIICLKPQSNQCPVNPHPTEI